MQYDMIFYKMNTTDFIQRSNDRCYPGGYFHTGNCYSSAMRLKVKEYNKDMDSKRQVCSY